MSLEAYLERRNKIVNDLDIPALKKEMPMLPQDRDEHWYLMVLHKSRLECTAIDDDKRHESARWLHHYNHKDIAGKPITLGILPV